MAKVSAVEKNNRRASWSKPYAAKRAALKAITKDRSKPMEERFKATPEARETAAQFRKGARSQPLRSSGRPRGYYRKLKMSRIALRELGSLAGFRAWSSPAGKGKRRCPCLILLAIC
jgi:small subunit ribosomal protein S14